MCRKFCERKNFQNTDISSIVGKGVTHVFVDRY